MKIHHIKFISAISHIIQKGELPAYTPEIGQAFEEIRPVLKAWFDELTERNVVAALEGQQFEGFRIAEGRKGNREFVKGAKDRIIELFKDAGLSESVLFETKLKTPARVEEFLEEEGRYDLLKEIEKFVIQQDGKPALKKIKEKEKENDE